MEYFQILQMENIENSVELQIKTDKFYERQQIIKIEDADNIVDGAVIYVTSNENNFYSDLIDTPLLLISDGLKNILCAYTDDLVFKYVGLVDYFEKTQQPYWLMLVEEIDCLSKNTEFKKDKTLKKLVLDQELIGKKKIFRVDNIVEKILVIDTDICESILRRCIQGIELKKIESTKKEV